MLTEDTLRLIATTLASALLLCGAASCKGDKKDKAKKGTVTYQAKLVSPSHGVVGTFRFTQAPGDPLVIEADVRGLSPGAHAVHIHKSGDCSDGYKKVGPHFMGGMKMMKGMKHKPMGDIGEVIADDKGASKTRLTTGKLSLFDGPTSLAGRSILVHAGPDAKPGAKVACGTIMKK